MINIYDKKNDCSGCAACLNICPMDCISMNADEEGFLYPLIDRDRCIECWLCRKVCRGAGTYTETTEDTVAYAVNNKDIQIRLASSSGGIFTLLADYVLNQNGAVFGAMMVDDCKNVHHMCIENREGLKALRGSKYVQSEIGDAYRKAEALLKEGRIVLFTGTPCQIHGLKAYLQKEYSDLITQDIVCHGVPSPMVWQNHIKAYENSYRNQVRLVDFRNKDISWRQYHIVFYFQDGKKVAVKRNSEPFMEGFINNLYLRPSCYTCKFKSISRNCDITLADFWGIQYVAPELNDDKGTSLVMIHTKKGNNIAKIIFKHCYTKLVDIDKALIFNQSAIQASPLHNNRKAFFKEYNGNNLEELVRKYCKSTVMSRISTKSKSLYRLYQLKINTPLKSNKTTT